MSNQVTILVDFTVEIDSRIWDDGDEEITFNGSTGFGFYDASLISENDDIVTASVKGESHAVWSSSEQVRANFDDISKAFDVSIFFGDHPATIQSTILYGVNTTCKPITTLL